MCTYTHNVHVTNTLFIVLLVYDTFLIYLDKPVPLQRPNRQRKPIPISEFGTNVTKLHENSNQGFKAEYDVSQLSFVLLNVINVVTNYVVFLQRRGHVYCYRCCSC